MTSKELNEILNKTRRTKDISLSVEQIKELVKDLERLEQIDNANPSKALKILETFNGGLLNKEIGAISYNQIWLENQIEALKQALLKAQEQDKILEKLKKPMFYSKRKKLGEEYIEWARENNVSQNDLTNIITWCFCFKMKEWLENE